MTSTSGWAGNHLRTVTLTVREIFIVGMGSMGDLTASVLLSPSSRRIRPCLLLLLLLILLKNIRKILPKIPSNMGHFRSIWGHLGPNFSIPDLHFFDFSKSVRNRPENIPKPSPNHPQTIPNPSQNFRFFRFFWSELKQLRNHNNAGCSQLLFFSIGFYWTEIGL